MRAEADNASAEQAEEKSIKLEREQTEAQAAARKLIEHLSQQGNMLGDWRARAEALLAEAPPTIARPGARRRALGLLGGAALCGAAATMIWALRQPDISAEMAQIFALHAAIQPAAISSGPSLTAASVPVRSAIAVQESKLQLSYQIQAQPLAEVATETIAQAPDPDTEQ
jgi:hypothetical protein